MSQIFTVDDQVKVRATGDAGEVVAVFKSRVTGYRVCVVEFPNGVVGAYVSNELEENDHTH